MLRNLGTRSSTGGRGPRGSPDSSPCPDEGGIRSAASSTELKTAPLKDLCALGGWKAPATVLTCYIQPDEATMRDPLAQRKALRVRRPV